MASTFLMEITMNDYPEPPTLRVLCTADGVTEVAVEGPAPKLANPYQITRAAAKLLSSWFQPELWDDSTDATMVLASQYVDPF